MRAKSCAKFFITNDKLYFSQRILEINLIFENCLHFTLYYTQKKIETVSVLTLGNKNWPRI